MNLLLIAVDIEYGVICWTFPSNLVDVSDQFGRLADFSLANLVLTNIFNKKAKGLYVLIMSGPMVVIGRKSSCEVYFQFMFRRHICISAIVMAEVPRHTGWRGWLCHFYWLRIHQWYKGKQIMPILLRTKIVGCHHTVLVSFSSCIFYII